MEFEVVDQKFRNGEALTDEEKSFLAIEYQRKIHAARMRCVNIRFHLKTQDSP